MKSLSKSHGILRLRCPKVLLSTVIRSHLELRLKVSIRYIHIYLQSFFLAVLGLRLDESLHFLYGFPEGGLDE